MENISSAVQYLQVLFMVFVLEYILTRTIAQELEGKGLNYCKQRGAKDC